MTAQAHEPSYTPGLKLQGLTQAEAQEAINTYAKHVKLQVGTRAKLREAVDHAYIDDIPLVSEATQKQAKRTANARVRLIQDEGVATYTSLASLRGTKEGGARSWVNRLRQENLLFTVEASGKTLVPLTQLTSDGQLDELVSKRLVKPLLSAGIEPWSLWSWITSPTGLLSGEVPAIAVRTELKRVDRAVERRVADLAYPAGA